MFGGILHFYQFRVRFTGSRDKVKQFTDGFTNRYTDGPIASEKLTRTFGSSESKNLKYFDRMHEVDLYLLYLDNIH